MSTAIVHRWGQSRYIDQTGLPWRPRPHVFYTNLAIDREVLDWLKERWGEPHSIQLFDGTPQHYGGREWCYCDCRVRESEEYQYGYAFRTAEQAIEFRMRWS